MKKETPLYNQFKTFFAKVSANGMSINPQILYAESFEKYVSTLIEEAKKEAVKVEK